MAATNTRFKLLEHAVGDAFLSTVQLRTPRRTSPGALPTDNG